MGKGNSGGGDNHDHDPRDSELARLEHERDSREGALTLRGYRIKYIHGNLYYKKDGSNKTWTFANFHYYQRYRLILWDRFTNTESKQMTDFAYEKGDYHPFYSYYKS